MKKNMNFKKVGKVEAGGSISHNQVGTCEEKQSADSSVGPNITLKL